MIRPWYGYALLGFAIALPVTLLSSDASATHRNWVLKNAGGQCVYDVPNTTNDEWADAVLYNGSSFNRSVSCPVALSGRWGSSSPALAAPLWAGALAANIYVRNGTNDGSSFSCYVSGRLDDTGSTTGTVYYSRTVATSAEGEQKLSILAWRSDWGGSLQTNKLKTLRGMAFHCSMPGNYSSIDGYKVKICQKGPSNGSTGDCFHTSANPDGDEAQVDEGQFVAGNEWVQTSGIECVPSVQNRLMERNFSGITNLGGLQTIYCPIVPSADDSREVQRKITGIRVYFKGIAPPSCLLTWLDRPNFTNYTGGTTNWSEPFTDSGQGFVSISSANTKTGLEIYSVVGCDTPGGVTIQGVTTYMEVARVDQGSN